MLDSEDSNLWSFQWANASTIVRLHIYKWAVKSRIHFLGANGPFGSATTNRIVSLYWCRTQGTKVNTAVKEYGNVIKHL